MTEIQTVKTLRLLEEQSELGLHCLPRRICRKADKHYVQELACCSRGEAALKVLRELSSPSREIGRSDSPIETVLILESHQS